MLQSEGDEDSIERGVAAQGTGAVEWMARLGYDVSGGAQHVRAGGDAIRGSTFALARVWHDASSVTRMVGSFGNGSAISLVVEGKVRVTQGSTSFEVGRGEGVVDSLRHATRLEVSGSVGSIELRVDESFSRRFGVLVADGLQPLSQSVNSVQWLLVLANTILAARGKHREKSWSFTRMALESQVAAVMVDVVGGGGNGGDDSVVDRAIEQIRRRSADPAFDVAALAATQSMTPRWLQMAFAERGLTPRRAIRLERTRAARRVLEADRGLTLEEVARRTGFPSSRALRQALRTFGETG